MDVGGQNHALAALTPGKDSVPIVQEAGWAPGPVWTSAENLVRTGIRSPDRPVRSKSLYRLSYPGPQSSMDIIYIYIYRYVNTYLDYIFSNKSHNCAYKICFRVLYNIHKEKSVCFSIRSNCQSF
jgi:hypothetical protein